MKAITRALTIFSTAITLIISSNSFSAEEQLSYSVAQSKDKQSKSAMLDLIKAKVDAQQSDKSIKKTQYLSREEHQKQKLAKSEEQITKQLVAGNQVLSNNSASRYNAAYYSFSIYQGYAQLIEDLDEDGYFQTFSITFDADAITSSNNDQFFVYAELYLSKNGGPWIHYYTTDDFVIFGESEDDIYEVYTTLDQGYPTDEYDVLIDLYEVGYADIVASYSSDDTNDLYALPLESSDYDPEYIVVHQHHRGGSSSATILLLLLSTLLLRTFNSHK